MNEGPVLSRVASVIADPARARMLTALMGGRALTATELAGAAMIAPSTASAHLARMVDAGLLTLCRQGRHRYFALAGAEVAQLLESMLGVAEQLGARPLKTGPRDPQLREARVCYDHLAGAMGVRLHDALLDAGVLESHDGQPRLTAFGTSWCQSAIPGADAWAARKRPICRGCLDWSERRTHLAGALGAGLLAHFMDRRWLRRIPDSRALETSPSGRAAFDEWLSRLGQ